MFRWFLILLFFVQSDLFSQDTIVDSVKPHSVKKAMILSAVLPGAGQIYNHIAMPKGEKKAFWKVPLIYAGLGTTTYLAVQNHMLQRELRAEYESRTAGNAPFNFTEYDQSGILTLFSSTRNRRDLLMVGVGFIYLLNIADAGIEAHFVDFDVSENLNLSFSPSYNAFQGFGLSARLKFR